MKNKLLLITNSFPFMPGEQFIETEIKYYKDVDLSIIPANSHKEVRKIDGAIEVIDSLHRARISYFLRFLYFIKSMSNREFFEELIFNCGWKPQRFLRFALSISNFQRYVDFFDSYFSNVEHPDSFVVYTYWNTEITYSLQKLKSKYNYKLISRIHGYDIYCERRPDGYMPLKRLFTKDIDRIFTITESAKAYLNKTYGYDITRLELARLGVECPNIAVQPSSKGRFHIVSCSFMVGVKRIDKVILSICELAKRLPHLRIKWIHLGDGPLMDELQIFAKRKLSMLSNVEYNFLGHLSNQQVFNFYRMNEVDVFVNLSSSEGVPVSIMEAMSCHIPIVAPDIGGISDMIIHNESGILLTCNPSTDEIASNLMHVEFFKDPAVRDEAYNIFKVRYDASRNYPEFLDQVFS